MSKMTRKLIFISILVMFLSSFIPNLVIHMIGVERTNFADVKPIYILYMAASTVFVTILLYSLIVNKVLVKRVNDLNQLTKEVIKGNYEITIDKPKNDELGELSSSFSDMTKALKENEYVNKSFIRNFSHEFKTPLATIKGYAELTLMDDTLSDETKSYLDIIVNESSRLSSLSENMLLISQMDHQVLIHKKDTFNITEMLRQIIQSKQLLFEQKGLTFDLDVEEVDITSDKGLLYHAFLNLVDNAIKYAAKDSCIDIHIINESNHVSFGISNTIDDPIEDADQLFNMFYTNPTNKSKSSGVGLSLVKKIIDKLDGDIQAFVKHLQFSVYVEIPK